ncbi:phage portal protein [Brochothrix campestris]|uniref:Prophage Lp3 protein 17, portal protein-like protein n=1 Tax=Brochothrix campestris FSL F6-1037 TaxID=1265861 RepID=W7CA85_9LIST|nr:phage portal protein [Brochothrix campestris]EUJ34265.1 prophage Lp3 protein 17, portal protein-like protein [Brochothrix campestris FSL F6-1037]
MGIFFKRSLGDNSQAVINYLSSPDTSSVMSFDSQQSLTQSDVFTAVKILSGDIASSSFVQRKNGRSDDLILEKLNVQPNVSMTPYAFLFAVTAQMLLTGNSFVVVNRKEKKVIDLTFAKPSQIVIYEDDITGELSYEYTDLGGRSRRLTSKEMLHFKAFTLNGKTGISPLYALKTELSMLKNGNNLLSAFFNKGIQAGGILKLSKANINNEAKKQIKKRL